MSDSTQEDVDSYTDDCWIELASGGRFNILKSPPSDITIEDIAYSLSNQCRYGGHCKEFYSVAEHSVLVSSLCSTENKLWGLLHDACEAYLMDLPRPIKRLLPDYHKLESRVISLIGERYGLPLEIPQEVKYWDTRVLRAESIQLMYHPETWGISWLDPADVDILCYPPIRAREEFMNMFRSLG